MPYQVTLAAVEKVIKQLDALANTNEDQITFEHRSPNTLKYALHQAFFAAKELKFQKYATLGENWKIRIRGVKVICERRDGFNPLSTSALEEIRKKRYSVTKFAEIIGTVIAEGERFELQYFPGIVLASDEEVQLTKFLEMKSKKWYYDDDPTNGLTIETNA